MCHPLYHNEYKKPVGQNGTTENQLKRLLCFFTLFFSNENANPMLIDKNKSVLIK